MIVQALLNLLFGLIGGIFSLMPTLDFPWLQNIKGAVQTLADLVRRADMIMYTRDVFIVLGAMIAINVFKVGFFVINWIIRRIADIIP